MVLEQLNVFPTPKDNIDMAQKIDDLKPWWWE